MAAPTTSGFQQGKWRVAAFAVVAAAGWLYCALFVLPATPLIRTTWAYDQWVNLEGAMRMLGGQRIYIDFFQFTLPGTELLYLTMFKVWGVRAWIPNAILLMVGVASFWIGLAVSRRIVCGSVSLLPTALFLPIFLAVPDATHHKLSVTVVLLAMGTLMPNRSGRRLMIAGLLIGLATVFTQSRGLVAVFLCAGFVAWENRSTPTRLIVDEACLLGAYGAVVAMAVWVLISRIGLTRFLDLIVVFPLKYYATDTRYNTWRAVWYQTMPSLVNLSDAMLFPLYAIVYLLPLAYAILLLRYRRGREDQTKPWKALILTATFGVALLAGGWYSPLFDRLAEASLPALIVSVWLISTSRWRTPLLKVASTAAIVLMLVSAALAQFGWHGILDLPSGRVAFADTETYHTYQWLLAHTRPGDEFLEASDMDDMYLLMHLRNPTQVPYLTANDYTRPEQVLDAITSLERDRVKYVLWNDDLDHPIASDAPGDHLAPMRDYLHRHYHLTTSFDCQFSGECQVFERIDGPGSTHEAADLEPHSP